MLAPEIAEEIVARYGTPTYVYDLAEVRAAHAELAAALPRPSRLHYSLKANPHPALVAQLVRLGCSCEVTSLGELAVALDAGARPDDVLVGGPAKSKVLLTAAVANGVTNLSVESPQDLRRAAAVAAVADRPVSTLLRVNADEAVSGMSLAMTGTASQFGVDSSWVAKRPGDFIAEGVTIVGLHLYMGTNIARVDRLAAQFAVSVRHARRLLEALGIEAREVNLGGGFAWPFARADRPEGLDRLREVVERNLDKWLPGWRSGAPCPSFESGRFLVGRAGTMLCRVMDVKPSKGQTFVILDAGINHLGGLSGLKRIPRVVPSLVLLGRPSSAAAGLTDCTVAGPLCTPADRFSQGVDLEHLTPGDVVAVPNVGAYGLTASLIGFLGHPIAAEVVVDEAGVVSATRLELNRTDLRGAPAIVE